ncbi:MAG TPA: mechanosensitive ion channel domain-containing protein [Gaiellaceae bacterium]|nr:mechanosensitive ion channel domain-containing protein [Gaiellaceae bacterium]
MPAFWQHVLIAVVVIAAASVVAKLVDWRIARRHLAPGIVTRYRVIRRTVFATIVFVGVLSALLVIPQIRAIAGGVLASSAVIGLVIGFASQRSIGNAVAGIMIAFTQPLRLGDKVVVEGTTGTVEEIGLTYTWLRTAEDDRFVVPNEKLASGTIRNLTIRRAGTYAAATVRVPLTADLRDVLQSLSVDGATAYVTELGSNEAIVSVRKRLTRVRNAEEASSDLRVEIAERLRETGVLSA